MNRAILNNSSGHTLIEVLAVAAIIGILATIPVSYLREAKLRANETAALGALNQIASAYEIYRVINPNGFYPHFQSNGETDELVEYSNPEQIWDMFIREGLLPGNLAQFNHTEDNLLAPGYRFSIYPLDYGAIQNYSVNPWESYAFALIPIDGGRQPRTLAVINGEHFDKYFTNARILKTTSATGNLESAGSYILADP